VVLFDIDGTLVTGPGGKRSAGMRAMEGSAHGLTGQPRLDEQVEFAGRTDRQIARALLQAGGHANPAPQEVEALIDAYVEQLHRGVERYPYQALGRVHEAVDALRAAGAVVGLGTGNVRKGARVKLASAGLIDRFDLSRGGFGDDADAREDLLRLGVERCDPRGELPVVVIGDTPYDIRAARAIGARCIAVTTGPYSAESLSPHAPDRIVDQLDRGVVLTIADLLTTRP